MDKVAMYKDYIYKQAALKPEINLYPHQKRVVDNPSSSMIIAHSVGSGKTLTGIAKFEKMKAEGTAHKALVVVPAGLRDNFGDSGVKKFTSSKYNIIGNKEEQRQKVYHAPDPNADYNVISYEMFKKDPESYLKSTGADTVISDEAHRGKNENTAVVSALKNTRHLYKNFIGMTGSLVSNTLSDVQPLVDVATGGKHNLGKNKEEFEQKWLLRNEYGPYKKYGEKRRPVIGFKNKRELSNELSKYVDYVDFDDIKDLANMPNKKVNIVKVPLSKDQVKLYKDILKKNPKVKQMIYQKRLETMKDDEAAKAFNTLIETRKLMNSVGSVKPGISLSESSKITPKTKKLLDDLDDYLKKTPDGQALLFSHLINGGVDVMEQGLKDKNISYGKFIGKGNKGVSEATRQKDVVDYNKRKKKVLLVSSAGGEGISLNDTTWEGVLDPHFNPEKMKQMEARGIRSGGLKDRKPEDREVQVNRYMATMPKFLKIFKAPPYKTPDEFIYEIAQNKDKQNKLLYDLLKQNNAKKKNKLG
jgi:SNF2 family DNA or RNA helicase